MLKTPLMLLGAILAAAGTATAGADDAMTLAKKLTGEGASIISSKNLTAIMATYSADSRVDIVSRNPSTGGLQRDSRAGKTEIQKLYEDLFKTEGSIDARNVVEHARFIGSNLLLITGTFEASNGGRTSSFPFMQIRTKEGDKWLITSVDVYVANHD